MTPSPLCAWGHVATTAELRTRGVRHATISEALRLGTMARVARGHFACTHLTGPREVAATSRTQLDCVTALDAIEDLWSGINRPGLHLRASPGQHIGPVPPGTIVHWAVATVPANSRLEVGTVDALLRAMRCLTSYDVIACIESALHLGYLDERGLSELHRGAPRWMTPHLRRIDRGAQSGLETHPRLWLQDLGHHVETQVAIPGAGVLDLLIDGKVGLETDGRKWHAHRFLADRSKDIGVEWWGIRVLRVGRPHIFETWPDTLATIERMLDYR